jgi:hypothetical protein
LKFVLVFFRSRLRTGLKIVITSLVLGALCAFPLWLIDALGTGTGTPTGTALLALFGTIAAGVGVAVGLVWLLVELIFVRR